MAKILQKYQLQKINKLTELDLAGWQIFWDETFDAHFFNSPNYFLSCLEIEPEIDCEIFFVLDGGKLVAVLPLVHTRKLGIKTLACPEGFGDALDMSSLLVKNKNKQENSEILKFLFDAIVKESNLYLKGVEEAFVELLKDKDGAIQKKCKVEFSCKRPWTKIDENPLGQMSGKIRRNLRKRIEKNKEHLVVEFEQNGNVDNLERMILVEKGSWKGQKKIALFDDKNARNLYRSWIQRGKEQVLIVFLKYDNKDIAYLLGHFFKDTFLVTNMAFLVDFAKISPGKVLVCKTLEHLQTKGLAIFDFSIGQSKIKSEFCEMATSQFNCYFGKNKLTCIWWSILLYIKRFLKRLLGK
jgi:CelD/BcsL family acetyltransferase involved in cellulose biosynthesis